MSQISDTNAEVQPPNTLQSRIVTLIVALILVGILFAIFNPQLVVALSG